MQKKGSVIWKIPSQEKTYNFLGRWWVSISFVAIYLPGLIYALRYGQASLASNSISFLTCWFNPTENWDFNPLWIGIFLNYGWVAFLLSMSERYSRNFGYFSNRYISINAVYAFGIATTYIMSGLGWFFTNTAGSGSSLVSFSLYASFSGKLIIDFFNWLLTWLRTDRKDFKITPSILFASIFALITLSSFVLSMQGYLSEGEMNHFVGLGVFSLFATTLILDRYYHNRQPRAK